MTGAAFKGVEKGCASYLELANHWFLNKGILSLILNCKNELEY
jgi:hypothetical protein